MGDLVEQLVGVVGAENVLTGAGVHDDYTHDEALTARAVVPLAVVTPGCTAEVVGIVAVAEESGTPVIARGSGTGLSGAAVPRADGILISFERMNQILEIDTENHVAVVQPGVTLEELDRVTSRPRSRLSRLPRREQRVARGERGHQRRGDAGHQVRGDPSSGPGLGSGSGHRRGDPDGGRFVKSSTGYDLTQIIVGSEGTLALVTEATLKLYPRAAHGATVLVPFGTLEEVARSVPPIVASGVGPLILEYIDMLTMAAITANVGLDLGVPTEVQRRCRRLSGRRPREHPRGPARAGHREPGRTARWARGPGRLRATGPGRRSVDQRPGEGLLRGQGGRGRRHHRRGGAPGRHPRLPGRRRRRGRESGDACDRLRTCGGRERPLSVFQPDAEKRGEVLRAIFRAGMELGGPSPGNTGSGRRRRPTSRNSRTRPRWRS